MDRRPPTGPLPAIAAGWWRSASPCSWFPTWRCWASTCWPQRDTATPTLTLPIKNFAQVDDRLWRGAAPTAAGLEALAANGVTTVIDVRAEDNLHVDEALLARLGLQRVHLPMRDGQSPTDAQVSRFLAPPRLVTARPAVPLWAPARAGPSSTAAAESGARARWLPPTSSGPARPPRPKRCAGTFSVGPPSLEQLAFSAGLSEDGAVSRPGNLMVAISRTLDARRRIWVNVRP